MFHGVGKLYLSSAPVRRYPTGAALLYIVHCQSTSLINCCVLWRAFLLLPAKAINHAPTGHGGHRSLTATIVPHSLRHHIQQSSSMLGDCCVRRRWEWGIVEAAVDHVMDVVGVLWVVPNVGISGIMCKPRPAMPPTARDSSFGAIIQFLRQKNNTTTTNKKSQLHRQNTPRSDQLQWQLALLIISLRINNSAVRNICLFFWNICIFFDVQIMASEQNHTQV